MHAAVLNPSLLAGQGPSLLSPNCNPTQSQTDERTQSFDLTPSSALPLLSSVFHTPPLPARHLTITTLHHPGIHHAIDLSIHPPYHPSIHLHAN